MYKKVKWTYKNNKMDVQKDSNERTKSKINVKWTLLLPTTGARRYFKVFVLSIERYVT